jgi:hypothetical protein
MSPVPPPARYDRPGGLSSARGPSLMLRTGSSLSGPSKKRSGAQVPQIQWRPLNARLWRQYFQRQQCRRTLRVARGSAARWRPWLAASESHDPRTIDTLKGPFELMLYEFPCWKPIVPPKVPSGRTVPAMFRASRSNFAWPIASLPRTVRVTLADLHRPFLTTIAEPFPLAVIGTSGTDIAKV